MTNTRTNTAYHHVTIVMCLQYADAMGTAAAPSSRATSSATSSSTFVALTNIGVREQFEYKIRLCVNAS